MMGWRDNYKVHPAADALPMMPDDELAKLGENIKANRLKEPIKFDAEGRVLDGRNRLEAMERAGIALRPCDRDVFLGGDAVSYILSKNIYRRHFRTKQEQAEAIVAILKAAEGAKANAEKPCNACTVSHKGGRGKVNPIKQDAIAAGEQAKIGKRTMQKALAKAEGTNPQKPKRPRRTDAEMERDHLLGRVSGVLHGIHYVKVPDAALDLLTKEQMADLAEDLEEAMATLGALRERLRQRLEPEAE
jgi:hypothetical protein